MTISSRKITAFTNLIAALEDVPVGLTSTQFKAYLDSSPEELRVKLNGLIDDLLLTTDGNSGADNIGATSIPGITGNTVQSLLEALKNAIDNIALGQIPDRSLQAIKIGLGEITTAELAFDPATQTELDTVSTVANNAIPKSIVTAQGDIIYGSSADTPARLAKGTAGQVLQIKSDGTVPEWGDTSLTKIAEVTIGTPQASITFNSIPNTYKALKLVHFLRGDTVGTTAIQVYMKINGDNAANYLQRMLLHADAGETTSSSSLNSSGAQICFMPGPNATANIFGVGETLLMNYAGAYQKVSLTNFASYPGFGNSGYYAGMSMGYWQSTAAINSITLIPFSNNFIAGSKVILYGIK